MTISERLFETLQKKEKKAADLCKILGIATSQTTAWKKRNSDPPAKYITQICEFLEVTPEYLLTGKNSNFTTEEIEMIRDFRLLEEEEKEMIRKKIKKLLPDQDEKEEKLSS